ncbi:hypothetical protein KAJ89_02675 [Candidatus Parcubacteria bacterium]|nr:hypothetical protein [Candidatus Parcubacteria bacterium]
MSKKFKIILLALLMILIIGIGFLIFNNPQIAVAGWYNDAWNYRKALVINHAQVAGDLENFPVLDHINHINPCYKKYG